MKILIPNPENKDTFQLRESSLKSSTAALRKWVRINQIRTHLRSAISAALTRSNMSLFSGFGITHSFALLVIIGGFMGYFKAGSVISLVMSLIFGVAILLSNMKGKVICIALLDLFFTYRYLTTFSLFPALAMLLLSSSVLLTLFVDTQLANRRSQKTH